MRRADRERQRGFTADEGAATLVAAVLSVALLSIAWLGYQIGAVVLSRHRAEGAADLAALAAASQVARGADAACGRAGDWRARCACTSPNAASTGRTRGCAPRPNPPAFRGAGRSSTAAPGPERSRPRLRGR